jgi:L-phenylalanine/L-methionine N-acetyltransferase
MSLLIRPAKTRSMLLTQEKIVVRRAMADDACALHRIYSQPSVLANTSQEPLASVEDTRRWITGAESTGYLLVAQAGPDVLGALHLQPSPYLALRHMAQINRVAVDEMHRGAGVGKRLLTTTLEMADNWLNLYRIELLVRADNAAAVELYRRVGFQDEGLLRGYGYRNGVYMDVLVMARLRGPLVN